jgi:DNA-binding transcriptional LysR family regulator
MDRLDALRAFIVAVDEGSLAAAGRRLGRSPAAMSRLLAGLEARAGFRLFERSTRRLRLTEPGSRYAEAGRRVLAEAAVLDGVAGREAGPSGQLTLTAPVSAGAQLLRPIVDDFLGLHAQVQARLLLLDRIVNLVEEGYDAALRIAHLADSSLIAMRVGQVRRLVCAAPDYLAAAAPLDTPEDLAGHRLIGLAETRHEHVWTFAGGRTVRVQPRLTVNNIAAARASAIAAHGVARLLSYQVIDDVLAGRLVIRLAAFEPPPLPVHLVAPKDRLAQPKTRRFVDFAAPLLKAAFAREAL